MSDGVCTIHTWYTQNEKKNLVYVCNDALRYREEPYVNVEDEYSFSHEGRSVHWFNDNVLVSFGFYTGRYLSDEEIRTFIERDTFKVLDSLRDNEFEWTGYSDFSLDYPFDYQLGNALLLCSSDVRLPLDDRGNECVPSWSCRNEPVICPEHGFKTRLCVDSSCGGETRTEVSCTPGMCSGCYVPTWTGYKVDKCVPYGIRFSQEISGSSFESKEERIKEIDDGEFSLQVVSDEKAIMKFYNQDGTVISEYVLVEGEKVTVFLPNWDDEIREFDLSVKDVYFEGLENKNNYIDVLKEYNVPQSYKLNAYCDIDGRVKEQKVKGGSEGEWPTCQNSYECASNLCSNGECVDIGEAIKEAGRAKGLFYRVLCRLANMFKEQEYSACVGEYIGYSPVEN